ncbi:MAG: hypothetical protein JW757_08685 [Anaerolineales bacterium]|nr:hypothetical protein [Anaerolineales bacterium]
MAKRKDAGKKFRIIFVRHSLTRIFRNLLFATVMVLILWWVAPYTPGFFRPPNDIYFLWAAVLFMVLMIFSLFFRNGSFVQARPQHLVIKVPFMRLRIPYDLVENVRMVVFKDLYDKKKMTWAQRRFLNPYLPRTVVRINLNKYPISPLLIQLFMPNYLILPADKGKGFVIYTKQYLELSTEIDSRLNAARVGQAEPRKKSSDDDMGLEGFFDLDG